MTAPAGTRTTFPPDGSSPTVEQPKAAVRMGEIGRERLNEIEGELLEVETRLGVLLQEKARLQATLRVAGG